MATLFNKKFMKVPNISKVRFFREIGRNAFVDWLLILSVTVIVAIVLMVGGFYLYWEISTGRFTVNNQETKTEEKIFDEKKLNLIIDRYDVKEATSRKARNGYSGAGDPSL